MNNRLGKKAVFTGWLILGFLGALFLAPDAQAYQVKRVITGLVNLGTAVEATTIDLVATGKLVSGDVLDVNKSVLFITRSVTDAANERTVRMNIMAMIDDPTHLLFSRRTAGPVMNIEYAIVEFTADSDVMVYAGMTTVPETIYYKNITLPANIVLAKSFPLLTTRTVLAINGNDEQEIFMGELTGTQTLRIDRSDVANSANTDVAYQVVAFGSTEADVNVQSGTFIFDNSTGTGETSDLNGTVTVGITSIDPAKSFLVFTLNPAVSCNGLDDLYAIEGTVTNATTLTFYRAVTSTSPTTVKWYLVEFKNNVLTQKGRKTGAGDSDSFSISNADGFSTAIYSNRALDIISVSGTGFGSVTTGLDDILYRASFTSAGTPPTTSTLALNREITPASTTNISWLAVEFPPLNIKYPNGGEPAFRVEDVVNVQWAHAKELETGGTHVDGSVKVKLLLDKASGTGAYPLTVAAGLSSKSDSYAWTIPNSLNPGPVNVIGSTLRMRIQCEEVYTSRNYDDSNADFEIKGSITVTAPNGAETWNVGDTARNITWNKTGDLSGSTFSIRLSEDGGTSYNTVIADLLAQGTYCAGNSCSYNWNPVGDYIGNNRRVRVFLASDAANVKDESNANFYIKGKLTLTAPNGGQSWPTQISNNITWNKWGTFSTVSLYYSTNSGGSYPNTIIAAAAAGAASGSYSWNVPAAAIGTFDRVKVVSDQAADLQVEDASDADFTVVASIKVTSPNAGTEVWRVGETQNITWTIGGSIANVKIEYSTDGGVTYPPANTIVASTPAAGGSYPWTMPDAIGSQVKVKISDVLAPTIYDESDNNFNIKGKLVVSSPNGNETYTAGSSQVMSWQKFGTIGNVNIKYSTDGGATYPNLITAAPIAASSLNYTWTPIPDSISATVKIKIELVSDPDGVFDVSDANFSIKGSLSLTAPNGGQTFNVGGNTQHCLDEKWQHWECGAEIFH